MGDWKKEDYVGQTFAFYGVDHHRFKVGDYVLEAVEDEDDGFRSALEELTLVTPTRGENIFFPRAIDTVRFEEDNEGNFRGYRLVALSDGHRWLRVGTDDVDDYYPCFTFQYTPRVPDQQPLPPEKRPVRLEELPDEALETELKRRRLSKNTPKVYELVAKWLEGQAALGQANRRNDNSYIFSEVEPELKQLYVEHFRKIAKAVRSMNPEEN